MPDGARCRTARNAERRMMPNGATGAQDNTGARAAQDNTGARAAQDNTGATARPGRYGFRERRVS